MGYPFAGRTSGDRFDLMYSQAPFSNGKAEIDSQLAELAQRLEPASFCGSALKAVSATMAKCWTLPATIVP